MQLRGLLSTSGMVYEILAQAQQIGLKNYTASCITNTRSGETSLVAHNATEIWLSWVGSTDYSMETGNAASGYQFKGADPHQELVQLIASLNQHTINDAATAHFSDYRSALGGFSLNLGQKADGSKTTAQLKQEYQVDVGNP